MLMWCEAFHHGVEIEYKKIHMVFFFHHPKNSFGLWLSPYCYCYCYQTHACNPFLAYLIWSLLVEGTIWQLCRPLDCFYLLSENFMNMLYPLQEVIMIHNCWGNTPRGWGARTRKVTGILIRVNNQGLIWKMILEVKMLHPPIWLL